jgi:hypothetical protein
MCPTACGGHPGQMGVRTVYRTWCTGNGCTGNGDCWEVSEYLGNSLLGSNQNMGKNQFIGE